MDAKPLLNFRYIFFPGVVPDTRVRGPAPSGGASALLIQGDDVDGSPAIEDVSLTGLLVQANPRVEMHGA